MRNKHHKNHPALALLRFESLESRQLLAADLIISEFMASNDTSLLDEDGDSADWIELFNASDTVRNLDGWHLTDDRDDLAQWRLPAITLEPGQHQLIFASAKDRSDPNAPLHTNFRLAAAGEYLALVQDDGSTIASEFAPTFPPQQTDVSFGVSPNQDLQGYFAQPTPGTANSSTPTPTPIPPIVINEIMYHPPGSDSAEEFLELHNPGSVDINLSGWQFDQGVQFEFPAGTTLDANAYLVIAADPVAFTTTYPDAPTAIGPWNGQLSNSGEGIRLIDAVGQTMDEVTYADEGDWAQRELDAANFSTPGWIWRNDHDGGGRSLELINPAQTNESGQNWAASTIDRGSPGQSNSVAAANIAPLIANVAHTPVIPQSNESVTVTATLSDETHVASATLNWRLDGSAEFTTIPLTDDGTGGDLTSGDGIFTATIPAQADTAIVEFYIQTQDALGMERSWPAPSFGGQQIANMLYQVDDRFDAAALQEPGSTPAYYQIMTAAERTLFENTNRDSNAQRHATLVAANGTGVEVRHNVSIRYRGSGSRNTNPPNNRLNLPADQPLYGLTAINMNVVSIADQILGSLLFRLAGMPAAEAKAVTMYSNGTNLRGNGFYAQLETLNGQFASNHFPQDDGGNVYNGRRPNESPPGGLGAGLVYHGEEQTPYVSYIKQTNASDADWSDVIGMTRVLNTAADDVYLEAIEEVIDVDQWLRHIALNALLANSEKGLLTGDALGDDYAMYAGVEDPRFVLVPHDLDTLFNANQVERSFFLGNGVPALRRLTNHPQIQARYFDQIEDLVNNLLRSESTHAAMRDAVSEVLNENQLNSILQFLESRGQFALGQIPNESLSVQSDLPIVGEFARSASRSVTLSGQITRQTQSVRVNGRPTEIDFARNTRRWRFDADPATPLLLPGINRVVIEAFDQPDGLGQLLQTTTIDIWHDDGSVQSVSGTLPADETVWTAEAGPYVVSADLVIPPDGQLTIQPGTSIYFEPDAKLVVQGSLQANGSAYRRIRFSAVPNGPIVPNQPNGSTGLPDGPARWNGIHFQDTQSANNRISMADIEYAQSLDGSIGVTNSQAHIDNVTFRGTHLRMIRSHNASLVVENSHFPDMFAENESPAALGLDNVAEHIKSTGRPGTDGQFVIRNNVFGTNKGHNDVIDADSGRRPDPILQVIDNVFMGAGDELLDLGGDAYIAGNLFMNVFKDDETSDRGYANAISTGDAGTETTVVVARNTFWEVDHAINLKRDTATIFENNTVVAVHPDFVDRFGNPNVGSAINFYVDEPGATPGWGAYAARNIFYDVPRVFGNVDLPEGEFTSLTLDQNLLSSELANQTIAERASTLLDLGQGNLIGDPRFVDSSIGDFRLQDGSAALQPGEGPGIGADVSENITIWGEPTRTTGQRSAQLQVAGPGIFAFRYRVNGGVWSDDVVIGNLGFRPDANTRTGQIELVDLADGPYVVEVLGQNFAGVWQTEPTVSQQWRVQTDSQLMISEVLASNSATFLQDGTTPDYIELRNLGGTAVNLGGYQLTDDETELNKFVFADDTAIAPGGFLIVKADNASDATGIHAGFSLNADGERVILSDANGQVIDSVQFGRQIDNLSISRIGPEMQWQLSQATPLQANQPQQTGDTDFLRINEWLADGGNQEDFLELYNADSLPVSLSGLLLTDEWGGDPSRQTIRPLSFVAARDYATFVRGSRNGLEFGLSGDQEILALLTPDEMPIDVVAYYPQTTGVSQGRAPDGGATIMYYVRPTPGQQNTNAIPGDIDEDNAVGFSDFLILSANFGLDEATREQGDLDGDGSVGFADFLLLSANFGN